MESKKINVTKAMGLIMVVCAIGIVLIKYFTNGDLDSYIFPIILFSVAMGVYFQKPKEPSSRIIVNSKSRKIIFTLVTIAILAGLVAFLVTIL